MSLTRLSASVLICAAAVLFPKGIHVNSAGEMGKALEPLFGKYASSLFFIGLFVLLLIMECN